jgi:transposase
MPTPSYRERIKKLERRRFLAGHLFAQGKTQAAVAERFGVTRAAVCQWYAAWKTDHRHGLRSTGPSGATPKLNTAQKRKLKHAILKGPARAGYPTDFWTLERIRALAKKTVKIDLGTTSVWRRVIELGFSVQKPERRAWERDERAITTWKLKEFPRLKKMGQDPRFSYRF